MKPKITLVHLDLGIGGAEQLVVSIACTLKSMGHAVSILTSHHDQNHCFDETKENGVLGDCIEVCGNWLPRHIFGKGTAYCAIIRMIYLSIILVSRYITRKIQKLARDFMYKYIIYSKPTSTANTTVEIDGDVCEELVFVDGVSAPMPLFYLSGTPSIFYCHFPDKLLCVQREGLLKQMYRAIIDHLEEFTTGCSTVVVVNSNFTAGVYQEAFPSLSLSRHLRPMVLYPTVEENDWNEDKNTEVINPLIKYSEGYDYVFVSLNRFERKKNIILAINALKYLKNNTAASDSSKRGSRRDNVLLVIAGGYDVSVKENAEYLLELLAYATSLDISYTYTPTTNTGTPTNTSTTSSKKSDDDGSIENIIPFSDKKNTDNGKGKNKDTSRNGETGLTVHIEFRTSISGAERNALLNRADALLYTPDREHFGIVPLEAMYACTPAICVKSGGPLETVLHGLSGYLCKETPDAFGEAMREFTKGTISENERKKLVNVLKGYSHVNQGLKRKGGKEVEVDLSTLSLSQLMGRIGRIHVQANFTSNSMMEKLDECIATAIKGNKRKPSLFTTAITRLVPVIILNIIILYFITLGIRIHNDTDA